MSHRFQNNWVYIFLIFLRLSTQNQRCHSAPHGANLTESYLLLASGAVVLQPVDDDEASVHLGECFLCWLLLVLVGGRLLVAAISAGLADLAEEPDEVAIFELVIYGVAVVGTRLL